MVKQKTLIIFTASYPWEIHHEQTFIEPEFKHHLACFDLIILVPTIIQGKMFSYPAGIKVEKSFAFELEKYSSLKKKICAICSFECICLVIEELKNYPLLLLNYAKLKRLLIYAMFAVATSQWLVKYIKDQKINPDFSVVYTYWLEFYSLGVGLTKKEFPQLKCVSRALGYDIYEFRNNPPYFPLRKKLLSRLDLLFPVSDAGKNYLIEKFPECSSKCQVFRLYINGLRRLNPFHKDGIFKMVSCSAVVPVKRVDLIFQSISFLAGIKKGVEFEWIHFGGGELFNELEQLTEQSPENLKCRLFGEVDNQQVLGFYKNQPVSLFINTSESEGTPVAIMEALSFGIPVVASNVGGNSEVVNEANGSLVRKHAEPEEIAEVIWAIISNPKVQKKKRSESFKMWEETLDAEKCYPVFAKKLSELIDVEDEK